MLEPRRVARRAPSKREAPDRCEGCQRRYGKNGPIRFRRKWLCGKCLVQPTETLAGGGLNGVGSST
jgi:hypothetical protein